VILINISKEMVLPNTGNGVVKLTPGKYAAINHNALNPRDYKIYATDANGQTVGNPLATVGVTVEDGVALIS
jgi:hypothetical protein